MTTTTIDQSETFTASTPLIGSVVITRDAGTPAGDPVIVNGGTLASLAGISSFTVSNGATFIPSSLASVAVGSNYIIDGGTLELGGPVGVSILNTYAFTSNGGNIVVEPGLGLNLSGAVTGWNSNSNIDFPDSSAVLGSYSPLTGDTTLAAYDGTTATGQSINVAGNILGLSPLGGSTTITTSDSDGGILVCFLAGVLIETPSGEVAVEDLRAGDTVMALVDGERVPKAVVWVGTRRVEGSQTEDDSYPIRIRRDAIADGIPRKDLLLTGEHCLFIDGNLVPARMLVNGRSILRDTTLGSFDIFHVETEGHSILLSDGMPSESYLDTGNRRVMNGRMRIAHPHAQRSWSADAVAPLNVSPTFVAPLWARIRDRAMAMGRPAATPVPRLTTDPHLRLDCGSGTGMPPLRRDGQRYFFRVPLDASSLCLNSRASRPSDVIGPFVDDRRTLGVCVGEVALWLGNTRVAQTGHLSDDRLPGWFTKDAPGARWTNGHGSLPFDSSLRHDLVMLEVQVVSAGPYAFTGDTVAAA
jgi:hypothetical protein